jgi:DNA-binding XRE family transcriptional regulator
MANTRKPALDDSGEVTNDRITRDDAIAAQYAGGPSLRTLRASGRIDPKALEEAERLRASGPPERPFRHLMAALRAERERQGLSLADLAERTGIDRAAIHKLEIGVNTNPTLSTLTRYAGALGARIEWDLKTTDANEPAKA